MSVTNLSGTKWSWNTDFAYIGQTPIATYSIQFKAPDIGAGTTIYTSIIFGDENEPDVAHMEYKDSSGEVIVVVANYGWNNNGQNIEFISGSDANNAELISYLEANATLISSPDIVIEYSGDVIATMSDTGSKTLETEGKYCIDDLIVNYEKPSGGGGVTNVSFSMSTPELSYYVDGNGDVQTANGQAIAQGVVCLSKSLFVGFSPTAFMGGLFGGTLIASVSLGSRALYKYAFIVQVN